MTPFQLWQPRRALVVLGIAAVLVPSALLAQEPATGTVTLNPIGSYRTGIYDEAAAEIATFDPASSRIFVTNASTGAIDILDASDPTNPTLVQSVDVGDYGSSVTSVDVFDGVIAAAIVGPEKTDNGAILFLDADGNVLSSVEAGALPDMLTFTPDGSIVLAANEGEPSDDYTVDPEGSITIVDLSGGVENLTQDAVTQISLAGFNDSELDPEVRIFGPEATVAQDLEPEYIAVAPDSSRAWVTLQEASALLEIDLATKTATAIHSLGFKDYSRPVVTSLESFEFIGLPVLGETPAGQEILLGGFSGLWFDGAGDDGTLHFITHTDRGPNGEPIDLDGDGVPERPFALPDFNPRLVFFDLDPASGAVSVTQEVELTLPDGSPVTGLPNLQGDAGFAHVDEIPIDLLGNVLPYAPYGGDFEGVARAAAGTLWLVDEYRPALYNFGEDGVLIERYVPEGSNESGVDTGVEALPGILAQRRWNRGFEAVAIDGDTLYAFVQSPLDNPDTASDSNSKASKLTRIISFDLPTATTTGMYLYPITGGAVDKIGDAVSLGDGQFLVVERDDAIGTDAGKYIFHVDLAGATNLLDIEEPTGLDRQSLAGLAFAGIQPAAKQFYANVAAAGYDFADKLEGMALVDENTLALINDNDFQLTGAFDPATGALEENPAPIGEFVTLVQTAPLTIDPSDRDGGPNMQSWPLLGVYMPDAIAAYDVDDETYLVTANEGDTRDWEGYSEVARLGDLVLDLAVFPNAAELQADENLGRLTTTTAGTDTNGDGLVDRILTLGGRSFSIWDGGGNLVWDSGDAFERYFVENDPANFNANNENDSTDNRSDDKGIEPEALALVHNGDRTYALVGLERQGGIFVYDITDPHAATFVTYVASRDFSGDAEADSGGDLGPEGIVFVPAEESPTGAPLLIVPYEVSGSTTLYDMQFGE